MLVDNTRSCKYSYVLLVMGEGIARNMYSRLEINKSRIAASCWSSFVIILVLHGHMNIKINTASDSGKERSWWSGHWSQIRTTRCHRVCFEEAALFVVRRKQFF
jgi:hypothetical protein